MHPPLKSLSNRFVRVILAVEQLQIRTPGPNATPYIGALVVQQRLGAKCLRADAWLDLTVDQTVLDKSCIVDE